MPPEASVPRMRLETTVNGRPVVLDIEPREMLLDLLRDRLDLTGTKRSCDTQVCGACTVLLDGAPVSACCTLAYEAGGRTVETIEGLASAAGLHPIQQAFVDQGAIQCGFCTPGFVLATKALLAENPQPTRAEIASWLGGNLCRCTGYWNILDAVEEAAERLAAHPHLNSSPNSDLAGGGMTRKTAVLRQTSPSPVPDGPGALWAAVGVRANAANTVPRPGPRSRTSGENAQGQAP